MYCMAQEKVTHADIVFITVSTGTSVRVSQDAPLTNVLPALIALGADSNTAIIVEGTPWSHHKDIRIVLDQVFPLARTNVSFNALSPVYWDFRKFAEELSRREQERRGTNAEPRVGADGKPAAQP